MKKPNITQGSWYYNDIYHNVESDIKDNGELICEVNYYGTDEEEEVANARAISAVPEMIDALVEAHGTLESLTYSGADKFVVEEELKNIEQALKKAGCN